MVYLYATEEKAKWALGIGAFVGFAAKFAVAAFHLTNPIGASLALIGVGLCLVGALLGTQDRSGAVGAVMAALGIGLAFGSGLGTMFVPLILAAKGGAVAGTIAMNNILGSGLGHAVFQAMPVPKG